MRCYSRGRYLGEDFEGDCAHIETGHYYTGLFLVFEGTIYGEGAVVFSVCHGKLTAKGPRLYWQFKEKDAIPVL